MHFKILSRFTSSKKKSALVHIAYRLRKMRTMWFNGLSDVSLGHCIKNMGLVISVFELDIISNRILYLNILVILVIWLKFFVENSFLKIYYIVYNVFRFTMSFLIFTKSLHVIETNTKLKWFWEFKARVNIFCLVWSGINI